MRDNSTCKLVYVDQNDKKHTKDTSVMSLKTDVFGLTFFDKDLSLLTTMTWDRIKSFSLEGSPSEDMVKDSIDQQAYRSDKRAPNSFNRTV